MLVWPLRRKLEPKLHWGSGDVSSLRQRNLVQKQSMLAMKGYFIGKTKDCRPIRPGQFLRT